MDLNTFFNPQSVAVVGASRDPQKVGGIVVKNIIESGFSGKLMLVNPKAERILDFECFPDYQSLPEIPDLAVIAIPAQFVPASLKQIADKGTKNVVVFTAGFREIGEEGKKLEKEVADFAEANQINLLGPNCLGFVNNSHNLNVTFAQTVKTLGPLRFISQSGAIASSIFDWCEANSMGFSQFVTLGNKAVLNENHFLQHWLNSSEVTPQLPDENNHMNIQPIGLYLESISDGKKFMDVSRKMSLKNPIFILKPGKSNAAAKAMQSHTGAIAGEDRVMEAAFAKSGLIRCHGMEDMFDLCRAFSWQQAPQGPKVAIISNAGGPAVISADVIEEEGLELSKFDDNTRQLLLDKLPREASILNPVDVLGDALAQRYRDACEIILQNKDVDSLIIILTPQIMTQIEETAQLISQLSTQYEKPIMCCFIGGSDIAKGEAILNYNKIPSFRFPERAIKALAAMWKWRLWKQIEVSSKKLVEGEANNPNPQLLTTNYQLPSNRTTLDSFEANELLKSVGISTPPTSSIESLEQASQFAKENGYPIVLKLSSHLLLHKTESGAVITGVNSDESLEKSFEQMKQNISKLADNVKSSVQIQIQKQVEKGIEVIVGVKRDANFGPVLMFGAGGTLAELIADRNLHILPIDQTQAIELIKESKVFKLLNGFRGAKPYTLETLADLIVKLSQLAQINDRISEIEINPVIITYEQAWAVDGKVVLK